MRERRNGELRTGMCKLVMAAARRAGIAVWEQWVQAAHLLAPASVCEEFWGHERADSKGLAERRGRVWPSPPAQKNDFFSLGMECFGETN